MQRTTDGTKTSEMIENEEQTLTLAQEEALLNEYKGALFEYLVALELQQCNREEQALSFFYRSLSREQRHSIELAERMIRQSRPHILHSLQAFAREVIHTFAQQYCEKKGISEVRLISKYIKKEQKEKSEADILIKLTDGRIVPLSLKLCTLNSFVNTKSAGPLSFIKKYFSSYGESVTSFLQNEFNQKIKEHYINMGQSHYQLLGLELPKDQHYYGVEWDERKLPRLPGHCSEEVQKLIYRYYHNVILEIEQIFKTFYELDSKKFSAALLWLMGHAHHDILQAICFYEKDKNGGYHYSKVQWVDQKMLEDKMLNMESTMQWQQVRPDLSFFAIKWGPWTLQIRVKPMNVFTTMALKINCSVQYLGSE